MSSSRAPRRLRRPGTWTHPHFSHKAAIQIIAHRQLLFCLHVSFTTISFWQVARLALLSLLAVFRDILPEYPIREPTAKELAAPVSKEVKAVRDYETKLLHQCQVPPRHRPAPPRPLCAAATPPPFSDG